MERSLYIGMYRRIYIRSFSGFLFKQGVDVQEEWSCIFWEIPGAPIYMFVWIYAGHSRLSAISDSRDCKCGSLIWLYRVYFLFHSTEFLWTQIYSI